MFPRCLFPVRVGDVINTNFLIMKIRNSLLAFPKWFVEYWCKISVDAYFERWLNIAKQCTYSWFTCYWQPLISKFKTTKHSQTFKIYANDIILLPIISLAQCHRRVDIVFDVYIDDSLKVKTNRKLDIGSRRKITGNTSTPKSWNTILRCNENIIEPFTADRIVSATFMT